MSDVPGLIDAINNANDEVAYPGLDTIRLEGGVYALLVPDNSLDGDNGLPVISSEVVLESDGDARIQRPMTAQGPFRLFYVQSTGNLTLRNITLWQGEANNVPTTTGGAIQNEGTTRLISSLVGYSKADFGGGIFNRGELYLGEARIHHNSAGRAGGGIYNSRGTVRSNATRRDTIYFNSAEEEGGGLSNHDGGVLTIGLITVATNSASDCGGINNRGSEATLNVSWVQWNIASILGGGICNGPGPEGEASQFALEAVVVGNNRAQTAGGIYNNGVMRIVHSGIRSNRAEGRGEQTSGGGIVNEGTMSIRASEVIQNSALGRDGAGIGRMMNGGSAQGGGITSLGELSLNIVSFRHNRALGGNGGVDPSGASGSGGYARGGAIYSRSELSGNDLDFLDNWALGGLAGRGRIPAARGYGAGGGLYNEEESSADLSRSYFGVNRADHGGGVYNHSNVSFSAENVTFSGNEGSAIYDYTGARTSLRWVTITQNQGGIYRWPGLVSIGSSIVTGNGTFDLSCREAAVVSSHGYNLFGGVRDPAGLDCLLETRTDRLDVAPDGVVDDTARERDTRWGGTTWVHQLYERGLAVDSGDPRDCPTSDQRGLSRPIDGNRDGTAVCDIGACEYDCSRPAR